jgi:hypothetical protein
MTTNVNFNLDEPKGRVLRRSDLKPGTAFVYGNAKQLFVVPDPAFSRHPNIAEKDIVVGGTHSGSLDDWHPSLEVIVVDLTATRSAVQPEPEVA